jgi:hypothetical protein
MGSILDLARNRKHLSCWGRGNLSSISLRRDSVRRWYRVGARVVHEGIRCVRGVIKSGKERRAAQMVTNAGHPDIEFINSKQ